MWNQLARRSTDFRRQAERGQALVLLALAFIGIAAFVGLVVDSGILFSNIGHLRRATDAASLAAANQFREGRTPTQLSALAFEMLELNGLSPSGVVAKICVLDYDPAPVPLPDLNYHDPSLCPGGTYPPSGPDDARKYVRVEAQLPINFAFLPIVGWNSTTISANSISEAASVDLVMVLDVSPSMSYNLCKDGLNNDEFVGGGEPAGEVDDCWINQPPACPPADCDGTNDIPESDVATCRAATLDENKCHPFEEVREAAHNLVDRLYFPYDRIGIVTFGRLADIHLELDDNDPPQPCGVNPNPSTCAHAVIDSLEVELEPDVPTMCPDWEDPPPKDPRGCMPTNTGDGLVKAGGMFCRDLVAYGGNGDGDCDRDEMREEAVWIVIILSDGVANAAVAKFPPVAPADWICPDTTWPPPTGSGPPYCSDGDPSTRHASGTSAYDADDFARDKADFVGCPSPPNANCAGTVPLGGQDAVIFSIGLGEAVTDYTKGGAPDQGEQLLRYIANVGDDGDPGNPDDPCIGRPIGADCGNYYFVLDPSGGELLDVFEAIASRIFTRITH